MGTFFRFRDFDPLSGALSNHAFPNFPQIAERARALLKSRTTEQVASTAAEIDWAIEKYLLDTQEQEFHRKKAKPASELRPVQDMNMPVEDDPSEVDTLKVLVDQGLKFGEAAVPNREEHEYFAVLSLWMLAEAMRWLNWRETLLDITYKSGGRQNNRPSITPHEVHVSLSNAGHYALRAMDAVCHAEHLCEMVRIKRVHTAEISDTYDDYAKREVERQEQERKKRSNQGVKLNIMRHQKNHEARTKAIEEWDKNRRFPGPERASIDIADSLQGQGFDAQPRTIAGWLRSYAKQIRIPHG